MVAMKYVFATVILNEVKDPSPLRVAASQPAGAARNDS